MSFFDTVSRIIQQGKEMAVKKTPVIRDNSPLGIAKNTITGLPQATRDLVQGTGQFKANSNLGIARNTVVGLPKATKEAFLPTRGYTEKELAEAKPSVSQNLQGIPKAGAELVTGLGELANTIPKYSETVNKITNNSVGDILFKGSKRLIEYGKPKNAEEAQAMRVYGDVASNFIPFGGTIKNIARNSKGLQSLSDQATNSIKNNPTGVRPDSMDYFRKNPDKITQGEVRLRELEDGSIHIEDGRHRLQVGTEKGIPPTLIDVTKEYTGQQSKKIAEIISQFTDPKRVPIRGEGGKLLGSFVDDGKDTKNVLEKTVLAKTDDVSDAKKYKSAAEYVKAQKIVYHGSNTELKQFSNKQGTFFTDDYMNADGYAGGENVYEGVLNLRNPLIIDAKGKLHRDLDTPYGKTTQEIVANVDNKKYDGVIFKNIKDNWIDDADADTPSTIYYAFKPKDSFLNESQLTDIWNKANTPIAKPLSILEAAKANLKNPQARQGGYIQNPLAGKETPPKVNNQVVSSSNDSIDSYIKTNITKRETARGSSSFYTRLKEIGGETGKKFIDYTLPISKALNKGKKEDLFFKAFLETNPSKDINNQIDRVLRAPTIATQFIKDNGLSQVVKEVDNLDEFDEYLIASHTVDVDARGINTGRDIKKDEQIVKYLSPKYEKQAKVVREYSQKLLDEATEAGLVSKETNKMLKERYPNYVPLNRIFDETELANQRTGNGKGVASLSKQTVVRKLEGSNREIESPVRSLYERTNSAVLQIEKNQAGKLIGSYEKIKGNPFGLVPLRTTADVQSRIDLYSTAKALKPLQNKADSIVKSNAKELRQINLELNKLNKQGVKIATSKQSTSSLSPLTSGVSVRKTKRTDVIPGVSKQEAHIPDEFFNELMSAEMAREAVLNNPLNSVIKYSNRNQTLPEVTGKGRSYFSNKGDQIADELGFENSEELRTAFAKFILDKPEILQRYKEANKIANEIVREQTKKRLVKSFDFTTKLIPVNYNPKKIINQMIASTDSQIEAVKRKIGNREPKVTALIDNLIVLRQELSDIKATRTSLVDEAQMLRDAEAKGKSTISFFDNGVKNIYEVDPEIAEAAKALNIEQLNILVRILAVPTRLLRLGATGINTAFLGANIVKDQVSAFIMADKGLRASIANPKNFLKGFWSAVGRDEMYDEWIRAGGGGTAYDLGRNQIKSTIERDRSKRTLFSRTINAGKNPLRTVEDLFARAEEITRLQQYRAGRDIATEKGLSKIDSTTAGARASRENSVNFARRGEWGSVLNATIPYFGASIQGSRLLVRNLKNKPIQTSTKIATTLLFPTAMATYWNMSDPIRKEVYDDIQDYEKEGNIILVPHNPIKDERGRWEVIKIPIPPGVGQFTNLVRRPIEQTYGLDKVKFKEIAKALVKTVSPVDITSGRGILSSLTPQIIKPSLESVTNTNLFTGRPIVYPNEAMKPPSEQVRDYTSGTARLIAKGLGTSPIKTEAFISSSGAGVAKNALNVSDKALAALGIIPKDQIGGTGIGESVSRRFTSAAGNKYRAGSKELDTALKAEETKTKETSSRITKSLSEFTGLTPEEQTAKLKELAQTDKEYAIKLRDALREENKKKTWSDVDKGIAQLGVENKARATYVYKKMKELPPDQRNTYIKDLHTRKVISDEVLNQISEMHKESVIIE